MSNFALKAINYPRVAAKAKRISLAYTPIESFGTDLLTRRKENSENICN